MLQVIYLAIILGSQQFQNSSDFTSPKIVNIVAQKVGFSRIIDNVCIACGLTGNLSDASKTSSVCEHFWKWALKGFQEDQTDKHVFRFVKTLYAVVLEFLLPLGKGGGGVAWWRSGGL